MRRMITNKQVVDIVNKGIEEGEIEAGGVSPEQKAVLDQISYDDENDSINIVAPLYVMENDAVAVGFAVETLEEDAQEAQIITDFNLNIVGAGDIKVNGQDILVAPENAPVAQQLVGINTSGEQNSLGIGEGLEVVNGELTAPYEIINLDFNKSTSVTISDDMYNKLYDNKNILIQLTNTNSGNYTGSLCKAQSANTYVAITNANSPAISSNTSAGLKVQGYKVAKVILGGTEGARTASVSDYPSSLFVNNVTAYDIPYFTELSGTKSYPTELSNTGSQRYFSHVIYRRGDNSDPNQAMVYLYIQYSPMKSGAGHSLKAIGEDDSYKYVLVWDRQTGVFTITQTAIS